MAKILFKIWSTVSHYNATFALAKSLQAHGHEVIYCGAEELRAYVAPEGFAFIAHEEKGIFNPFLGNHSHSQQSTAEVSPFPSGKGRPKRADRMIRWGWRSCPRR